MRQVLCPVLVGRAEETRHLTAALGAAGAGRGGMVFVTGEAGIILTHLLGRDHVRVYDGSWAEWGRAGHTPVVQGHA